MLGVSTFPDLAHCLAMNPLGLKAAIEESCKKANLNVVVAAVVGDDLTVRVMTGLC